MVLFPALILGLGLIPAGRLTAQGLTTLHGFTATDPKTGANTDGANPQAGLVVSGNTLYGTAAAGGRSGNGTVFALSTNGTGFRNLYSFGSSPNDGADPQAGLILSLSGNTLYGTAAAGGSSGNGTVFGINANGTGFTTLYRFTAFPVGYFTNSDGAFPYAGLILSGNTLYGTAKAGGRSGNGSVFSLFLPPQLTIIRSGTNVTLTWPTNATGFTLKFATNLVSPIFWYTNSPAPVVINGQNTVTNPISGTHQFFRLSNP